MNHEPQTLRPGARIGRGQVLTCLGSGQTGAVYSVADSSGDVIAVREYLPPGLATRTPEAVVPLASHEAAFEAGLRCFLDDGQRHAAQDHPSLLKVHEVWSHNGTAYMAMPLLRGRTLAQFMGAGTERVAPAQLASWARSIADALMPLHRGLGLHGHIAPDQIMITPAGRPVLMEFGRTRWVVAAATGEAAAALRTAYSPIELQASERSADALGPWTDIYALSAVLYFAACGASPPAPEARLAVDHAEPLKPPAASPYSAAFLQGLERGLAVCAPARPQSLGEFMAMLGWPERRTRRRIPGESLTVRLLDPDVQAEALPAVPAPHPLPHAALAEASPREPQRARREFPPIEPGRLDVPPPVVRKEAPIAVPPPAAERRREAHARDVSSDRHRLEAQVFAASAIERIRALQPEAARASVVAPGRFTAPPPSEGHARHGVLLLIVVWMVAIATGWWVWSEERFPQEAAPALQVGVPSTSTASPTESSRPGTTAEAVPPPRRP